MKTIIQFISVMIMLSACSGDAGQKIPNVNDPVPVKVISISPLMVREPIHASGVFSTDDEAIRAFKTGGIVKRIFVDEGDAIRKGELLATLDMTEITAQVSRATLAWEKAQRDYARLSNLYRDSVITLEMFENASTMLEMSREQLTEARFNQEHSEIRATEDGFILRKFVNEGQVVGAGTPVFQTNGAGDGEWLLRVAISDVQWSNIAIGDSALITSDATPHRVIPARISARSEGVDPYSGTFTLDVKPLTLMGTPVASGMFGRATITPSKSMKMWKIPYDAVLDGNGTTGYVFITNDQKTAEKRKISIAGLSRDYILCDEGLDSSNTIIISGSAYLDHGSTISIIKE